MTDPDRPEPADERLLDLAYRVTDDAPVDWEITRQSASDLGETIERLRQLQAIGELNRRRDDPAGVEKTRFTWGSLRVIDKLGEGGFGEVWRAWDPALQREVALKLRRPGPGGAGESRWLREAQRLARVRHPHVLTVHGTDVHDGRAGIWTDLIRGRTLEQLLLEQGPLGAREVVAIGLDLCAALAAVHGAGLVHGDVKTRNVMREGVSIGSAAATGAGRIVLMDFGTASERAEDSIGSGPAAGTPLFAAPELLDDASPTVASDIYSLGVVLYRLASGRFPVDAARLEELHERHRRRERTPLRTLRPDLPGALVQAIERALAQDPAQRFPSAGEMERALAAVFATPGEIIRIGSTRRMLIAFAIGAATIGLVWAGVTWGPWLLKPRFRIKPVGARVATQLLQSVPGHEEAGYTGWSLAAPGDLDRDGHTDLLVSGPGEHPPSGGVTLFHGGADGSFSPWRSYAGPHADGFGHRVAALGDVDGDHHPDFAVSAIYEDTPGAIRAGAVYVYRGGVSPDSLPAYRLAGERASADFGYDVAAAGDVNHDGYADFLVGAPLEGSAGPFSGRAYLFLGGPHPHTKPDVVYRPTAPGGQFGYSVAGIGDINGDGYDDVAIGANGDPTVARGAGKVTVYYGGPRPDAEPGLTLLAVARGNWFGSSIARLGDLNGDGFDDFGVGAERADGYGEWAGTVSIFLGGRNPSSRPHLVLRGESENAKFGHRIAGGVDLNGDGYPDLAVGEYFADDNGPYSGSTLVFFGGPTLDDIADLRLSADAYWGNFGYDLVAIPAGGTEAARVVVGAPDSRPGGRWFNFALSRYSFTVPHRGARWASGRRAEVAWSGAERAELEWSPLPGGPWRPLARRVGGREQNAMSVTVPPEAQGPIQLRLRPSTPGVTGAVISDTIRVGSPR